MMCIKFTAFDPHKVSIFYHRFIYLFINKLHICLLIAIVTLLIAIQSSFLEASPYLLTLDSE
jgi:hypothetical protein